MRGCARILSTFRSLRASDSTTSEDTQARLAKLDARLEQQGVAQQADAADLRGRLAEIERKLAGE